MKPGFAKQKAKKQQKKRQRQKRQKQNKDVELKDAQIDGDTQIEDSTGLTARDKHKNKLHIKQQLKLRVKSLKAARGKLTKLPGNKQERKQLSTEIKQLIQAQAQPGTEVPQQQTPFEVSTSAEAMVE